MLAFADDIVLIAPRKGSLQKLVSLFARFCECNNLVINTKKTEVMLVHHSEEGRDRHVYV